MFQISLRAARVNAGLKQREAAEAIGVDVSTIISWEKGKTAPKSYQLRALCNTYSVPIDRILLLQNSTLSEQKDEEKGLFQLCGG